MIRMKFTNMITIDRPPAAVFTFLAQFDNVPMWNYAIDKTWKVTDGPAGVGSRYRQTRTIPRKSEEAFEVTEFEPHHRLCIRGALGPLYGDVSYLLAPAGNGTVLTNTMNLQPSGALRLVAPVVAFRVKSAVAANLDALKQILEAEGRPDSGGPRRGSQP